MARRVTASTETTAKQRYILKGVVYIEDVEYRKGATIELTKKEASHPLFVNKLQKIGATEVIVDTKEVDRLTKALLKSQEEVERLKERLERLESLPSENTDTL